ncbi:MAG TPA: F0F1 ATP synthase subunit epsilon [Bacteroidota bacterium]|nr:F0F1 ATP synthase subunit epsilon [Bacteroidota bacterium]
MSTTFDVELITPQRVEFTGPVRSVTCPGVQGRFQVLHNHAPFLSSLEIGILTLVDADEQQRTYAISGGVAQVFHNHMRILAETAELASNIDVERATRARQRAEERLKQRDASLDQERARVAMLRALNRLKAVGRA